MQKIIYFGILILSAAFTFYLLFVATPSDKPLIDDDIVILIQD